MDEGGVRRAGLVVSVLGVQCEVAFDGATVRAWLDRDMRVVVGDEVLVGGEGAEARVLERSERRSALSRPDPHETGKELVLAANVDVAAIVVSVANPPFHPRLIDRFLVVVQRGDITPLICVNKVDLPHDAAELEAQLAPYRELGVTVVYCAAASNVGIEELGAAVAGKTCVFVGHSGVGKSSLVASLDPAGEHRVGRVRESDGRGRHTTTRSVLVALGDGTRIIDTPGIRALGLFELSKEDLRFYFPDLEEAARDCRFRDCSHTVEPGCAIEDAAKEGRVSPVRYETYRRLLASIEPQKQ